MVMGARFEFPGQVAREQKSINDFFVFVTEMVDQL